MNKKILYFGIAFVITALAAINVNVNSYKRWLCACKQLSYYYTGISIHLFR